MKAKHGSRLDVFLTNTWYCDDRIMDSCDKNIPSLKDNSSFFLHLSLLEENGNESVLYCCEHVIVTIWL